MPRAFVRHDHHHQVDIFHTGLQTPASATNAEERRRTPRAGGEPACGEAPAMLAAKNESALDHTGHHGDALGALVNFGRNSLVGSRGKIVEHRGCGVQPRLYFRFGLVGARGNYRAKSEKRYSYKKFF